MVWDLPGSSGFDLRNLDRVQDTSVDVRPEKDCGLLGANLFGDIMESLPPFPPEFSHLIPSTPTIIDLPPWTEKQREDYESDPLGWIDRQGWF